MRAMQRRDDKVSPLTSLVVIVLMSVGMWAVIIEVARYILRAL